MGRGVGMDAHVRGVAVPQGRAQHRSVSMDVSELLAFLVDERPLLVEFPWQSLNNLVALPRASPAVETEACPMRTP